MDEEVNEPKKKGRPKKVLGSVTEKTNVEIIKEVVVPSKTMVRYNLEGEISRMRNELLNRLSL